MWKLWYLTVLDTNYVFVLCDVLRQSALVLDLAADGSSLPAGLGFRCLVMCIVWGSVLMCAEASGSGVAGSLPVRDPLTSSGSEEGGVKSCFTPMQRASCVSTEDVCM